jgi:hypothetical protein
LDGRALQNQIQSSSRQPDAAELPGGNLVYFTAIWCILWQLGVFYGNLVYFMAIWCILWQFCIFYGKLVYFMANWYILMQIGIFYVNLIYFMAIWYIVSRYGTLHQEKSGKPEYRHSNLQNIC